MTRRLRKKKSRMSKFIMSILMVVIVASIYKFIIIPKNKSIIIPVNQNKLEEEYEDSVIQVSSDDSAIEVSSPDIETNYTVSISTDNLNSSNAILISLEDDAILMQKESKEKIYPASLTKMMTAIVAIENLPDLQVKIQLSNSTFQGLYEANASMTGFQPDEEVRAIDLLYGAMLPSGAESCIGLADQIAGSEQNFVEMMNQKAADLGMENTHFENTTGLHDDNHYTTVEDMAILLRYALKNDTFRKIFTTSSHYIKPTNKHPDGMTCYSTMFKKLNNQDIIGGKILGGKTGYTGEAGLCLASLAKVVDREYILITVGAEGDPYSEQYNITDALAVYNSIKKQ